MQMLPLSAKILMTQQRIRAWYKYWDGNVYVSFSGGKDSTVLLHMVREEYPDVEAVFVNTGLEYPEIQKFVKSFDNVTILKPEMRFDEVIKKYGYPLISKKVSHGIRYYKKGSAWAINAFSGLHCQTGKPSEFCKNQYEKWKPLVEMPFSDQCCEKMKERPLDAFAKKYNKKPITALLACESYRRTQAWLSTGCNAFNSKKPMSKPMSFWTEQDVLWYIKKYNIPIASVYGKIEYKDNDDQVRMIECDPDDCSFADELEKLVTTGCDRTGCIFCGFGCHLDKNPSRFQRLKVTHPKQYDYCINGGEYVDGVWQPNQKGLGMGHVFDALNEIYGEGFINYK